MRLMPRGAHVVIGLHCAAASPTKMPGSIGSPQVVASPVSLNALQAVESPHIMGPPQAAWSARSPWGCWGRHMRGVDGSMGSPQTVASPGSLGVPQAMQSPQDMERADAIVRKGFRRRLIGGSPCMWVPQARVQRREPSDGVSCLSARKALQGLFQVFHGLACLDQGFQSLPLVNMALAGLPRPPEAFRGLRRPSRKLGGPLHCWPYPQAPERAHASNPGRRRGAAGAPARHQAARPRSLRHCPRLSTQRRPVSCTGRATHIHAHRHGRPAALVRARQPSAPPRFGGAKGSRHDDDGSECESPGRRGFKLTLLPKRVARNLRRRRVLGVLSPSGGSARALNLHAGARALPQRQLQRRIDRLLEALARRARASRGAPVHEASVDRTRGSTP